MVDDGFIGRLSGGLSPELIAAGLLVLASICFFLAALSVLMVVRRRDTAADSAASRSVPGAGTGEAAPPPERRTRRRSPVSEVLIDRAAGNTGAGNRDFDHEIALARQGCSAEQLVRECGLTRVEARLLVRLYGSDAA